MGPAAGGPRGPEVRMSTRWASPTVGCPIRRSSAALMRQNLGPGGSGTADGSHPVVPVRGAVSPGRTGGFHLGVPIRCARVRCCNPDRGAVALAPFWTIHREPVFAGPGPKSGAPVQWWGLRHDAGVPCRKAGSGGGISGGWNQPLLRGGKVFLLSGRRGQCCPQRCRI